MRWIMPRRGERGAAAVEAAIIFPVLVLLTFGIIEFSLLLRDYVSLNSIVRNGVRVATTLPRDPAFVATTVDAMNKSGSALPDDAYEELWIYEADEKGLPNGVVIRDEPCPAPGEPGYKKTCRDGEWLVESCTSTNNCIAYTWNEGRDEFLPASGSAWDPESINACPGDDEADVVGVYLKARHTWVTGLFASETYISDRAVSKFEPIATSFGVECRPGVTP